MEDEKAEVTESDAPATAEHLAGDGELDLELDDVSHDGDEEDEEDEGIINGRIPSGNSSLNLNAHEELSDSSDSMEGGEDNSGTLTKRNQNQELNDESELLDDEEEDDDDEVLEIPNSDPLRRRQTEIDLVELSGDEEEEDEVNGLGSRDSSIQPTSELDNSIDSIVETPCEETQQNKKKIIKKPLRLRGGENTGDDEIIEIPEADPLGADEVLDEDLELSDEEGLVINNVNSMDSSFNATSEMDNSVDSADDGGPEDEDEANNAIVVNSTKSLAQLATSAVSSNNNTTNSTIININTPPTAKKDQSKEPTLVIIDTNSILCGKGPIPIQKPNITSTVSINNQTNQSTRPTSKGDILLAPSKTGSNTINIPDDAFLIEAPSFIVPYVFEQTGDKVLKSYIKDIEAEIKLEKKIANNGESDDDEPLPKKKSEDYFESPVGKLLVNLGMSLVQEYVQVDLLKLQRRKAEKEKSKSRGGVVPMQTQQSIISLKNNIEESKENNEPFRFPMHKCKNCNFKTESDLVMSTHLETPHMRNNCYRCNFCKHTTKLPHEILLHMELDHKIRPRLERAPAYHQCPHCAFEDNSKAKLTRHLISCTKRFRLEKNLEPPLDWDTPGKLPKMPKNRLLHQATFNTATGYVNTAQQQSQRNVLVQYPTMSSMATKYMQQGPRMQLPPLLQAPKAKPLPGLIRTNPAAMMNPVNKVNPNLPRGMIMRTASGQQVLTQPQIVGGQIIHQVIGNQLGIATNANVPGFLSKLGLVSNPPVSQNPRSASQLVRNANAANKNSQPSISITPLPRQSAIPAPAIASQVKPQGKTSFVICEICDGYIKDLDQLRNHMQWIHKVKIHPKMIYNKPPLNCQKCQFRFFTDQGLERHLLGSHGLVTSSMQEAANKGQDNGRCPLCGKVYQWKLLAHVAKDHNVTLKPAHLSYKCTVCTATFGMYKLFESHVYSAHSANSKRNNTGIVNSGRSTPANNRSQMQVTSRTMPATSSQNSYKPLKINDEITIIPQPLANASPIRTKGSLTITPHSNNTNRRSVRSNGGGDEGIEIIEIDETSNGRKENGEYRSRQAVTESALRKRNLEISVCGTDSDNSDDSYQRAPPAKRLRGN